MKLAPGLVQREEPKAAQDESLALPLGPGPVARPLSVHAALRPFRSSMRLPSTSLPASPARLVESGVQVCARHQGESGACLGRLAARRVPQRAPQAVLTQHGQQPVLRCGGRQRGGAGLAGGGQPARYDASAGEGEVALPGGAARACGTLDAQGSSERGRTQQSHELRMPPTRLRPPG